MYIVNTWFGSFKVDDDESIIKQELFSVEEIQNRLLRGELIVERNLQKISFLDLAIKSNFAGSKDEYLGLLHTTAIELAEKKVDASIGEDQIIILAINTLDEIDETLNLFCEKLRNWSYLYSFDITKNDCEEQISNLMQCKLKQEEVRCSLQELIEKKMNEIAPNITNLAGPLIGARLISLAYGMKNISRMPSGTIQILGAKKALFRHLEKGTPPPKYGVIFKHPLIAGAPWWQRGKIAKALSSKLAIASRIDFFSGNTDNKLTDDLNCAIEMIKAKYPDPPTNKRPPTKKN